MTRSFSTTLCVCFAASLVFTASCSQSAGETCQTDGNCGDGLVCCKGDTAERGYCGKKSDTECGRTGDEVVEDSGARDAAMSTDSSVEDSGSTDAAMSIDDGGGDGG